MDEPTKPEPSTRAPRGSTHFLIATAGVMALSLLLTIIATAWPLPPVCTASGLTNPAWHSAAKIPVDLANIGAIGSLVGGFFCFLGLVAAQGRRLAFLGLSVLAVGLILFALVVAFGIGLPCHPFY